MTNKKSNRQKKFRKLKCYLCKKPSGGLYHLKPLCNKCFVEARYNNRCEFRKKPENVLQKEKANRKPKTVAKTPKTESKPHKKRQFDMVHTANKGGDYPD